MADETINLSHSDDENDILIISLTGKSIAIDEDDLEPIYELFKNIITDSQWLRGEHFPYEYMLQISHLVKLFRNIKSYDFVIKSIFKIKVNLGTESKELKCDFDRLNFILSDIMASYIDFKSSSLEPNIFEKKISPKTEDYECNSVLQKLFIIFNGDMTPITLTLLKCNPTNTYFPFLNKIFEKILSKKHYHEDNVNDFLTYLRLLLCYKHWKQLFTSNNFIFYCKKQVTAIATNSEKKVTDIVTNCEKQVTDNTTKCKKQVTAIVKNCEKQVTDIAMDILPSDIPVYKPTSESDITIQFCKILPKLTTDKMEKATKNLLDYSGCDTNRLIKSFLELYEKKISYVEVQSPVKLKPKNKAKVQNNEIVTCKNSISIQRKTKRTAIKQQSASNITNSLIQRNLVSSQSNNEATYSVNVNLNIRNFKGSEPSMRNNEEFNVNINLLNLRNSEFSKKEFNDIIEISDEDVPNKTKIECNKRKLYLPKSSNDVPILKHSKIENNNISCKPISSLLDNNNSNGSRLSEVKTSSNVSETAVAQSNQIENKPRNSLNDRESISTSDNWLTKKYTETSEHILNLHLFDEPPKVTRVYAKVASHPDIIYRNTSQTKDCSSYGPVPTDKVIFSMPKSYEKNSPISAHITSDIFLQNKSNGTDRNSIDRSLIDKVNQDVIQTSEKHKTKTNNKKTNKLDEHSTVLVNSEPPSTSEFINSIQNIESLEEKITILKAESNFNSSNAVNCVKIESVCLETITDKNIVNPPEIVEINKHEMTTQNVQVSHKSFDLCTNIIKSTKIALQEISNLQETNANNLNKICESNITVTEKTITDNAESNINSVLTDKNSLELTEDYEDTSADKVSLDTIPSDLIKLSSILTEKVELDAINGKQIPATSKTNFSLNNKKNEINIDPTTQSKEPISVETKNKLNQTILNGVETEKRLLPLQTASSTENCKKTKITKNFRKNHKLIKNIYSDCPQTLKETHLKIVGTAEMKNVTVTENHVMQPTTTSSIDNCIKTNMPQNFPDNSKLIQNLNSERFQTLEKIVRTADEKNVSETENHLLQLPSFSTKEICIKTNMSPYFTENYKLIQNSNSNHPQALENIIIVGIADKKNETETENHLFQLPTTSSTENCIKTNMPSNFPENQKLNLNYKCQPTAEKKFHKNVRTTDKKNITKKLKLNLKTNEEIKSTQQIICVKDKARICQKKLDPRTENKTKEQKKSVEESYQSQKTSQEEFMLTVQLKPVFPRILPKIIEDNLPKKLCNKKLENICLKLEANLIKNKSKFSFVNRKIQQPQENCDEKISSTDIFKNNKIAENKLEKIIEYFEPKQKFEEDTVDAEHNINMLASVALTSVVIEDINETQSQKCKKFKKSVADESLSNLAPIRLTRNSSNKYDKDEVNEDFVKATNTNVMKVNKRKSYVDSKICNISKKVKETINDKQSEDENKSKFDNDSMLGAKVTNNGNKSIDNLAMVLWEKKNIKSPEWLDSTLFNLNKIDKEIVTSTPKQITSKPEEENDREIKKEDTSIDEKIKIKCSIIVDDLVRKNMDLKNDSQVLSDDEDNILSKNFNFDTNISSFVCNRVNLDKILDTPSKESEMDFSLNHITNADKLKDESENDKEISMSVSPNFEHTRKEANSEFSAIDFYGWYDILPSPSLSKDDQLDYDFSETLDLEDLINSQSENISSTTNTIFTGDRLISGNNEYILSKQVGHSNNACNPFDFSTTSDFFELEYSQHNSPEQSSNENTNNELINEIFFSNSDTQQASSQLNPNEFLNLSTESVIQKLESSTLSENPNLDEISLEEMKVMTTDNILNKSVKKIYEKPSVEELKKQINENIEKKKITAKIDTPSKLSRRMHKIPSGSYKKNVKLLTKFEEDNISKTKNLDSDDRNLSLVFSNNGSLPSLIDDDLLPPSLDLQNKLPITDKPNLVRKLFNSQSLPLEKISEKSKIDYSEIFNKLKSEEKNETISINKSLPTVQLTKNSLITLRNHDESKRKQKHDNLNQSQNSFKLKSSSSASAPIKKQTKNIFENPKNINLSNVNKCSDNKIKLSTFRHPNVIGDVGTKCNQQLNSHNRRKTDPNETHSNINLSDSKLHSQSSNSLCRRSTTPPNKKRRMVYAPIGNEFGKWVAK